MFCPVGSGDGDSDDEGSAFYGTDEEDNKDEATFIETKEELEDIRLSRHKLEQCVLITSRMDTINEWKK